MTSIDLRQVTLRRYGRVSIISPKEVHRRITAILGDDYTKLQVKRALKYLNCQVIRDRRGQLGYPAPIVNTLIERFRKGELDDYV